MGRDGVWRCPSRAVAHVDEFAQRASISADVGDLDGEHVAAVSQPGGVERRTGEPEQVLAGLTPDEVMGEHREVLVRPAV